MRADAERRGASAQPWLERLSATATRERAVIRLGVVPATRSLPPGRLELPPQQPLFSSLPDANLGRIFLLSQVIPPLARAGGSVTDANHGEVVSERTGIAQSTISAIETDRIKLGAERAKTLARALHVHPAVLLFPGWKTEDESAA